MMDYEWLVKDINRKKSQICKWVNALYREGVCTLEDRTNQLIHINQMNHKEIDDMYRDFFFKL